MSLFKLKNLLIAVSAVLGLSLMSAGGAQADARLCNQTPYGILFAYRTQVGTAGNMYFHTSGWTRINSGYCLTIMNGNAALAYHDIAAVILSEPVQAFRAVGETPLMRCVTSGDFAYTGSPDPCPVGYYRYPFYRFNTEYYNATFTIS